MLRISLRFYKRKMKYLVNACITHQKRYCPQVMHRDSKVIKLRSFLFALSALITIYAPTYSDEIFGFHGFGSLCRSIQYTVAIVSILWCISDFQKGKRIKIGSMFIVCFALAVFFSKKLKCLQ